MTPASDDYGFWLKAAIAIIGMLQFALVAAAGWIFSEVAFKRWVEQVLEKRFEQDQVHDRQTFTDLIAPIISRLDTTEGRVMEMHMENQRGIKRIEDILMSRTAVITKR